MASVTLTSAAGRSLLFVCPAHERHELAQVCYRQFAHLASTLRERDLHADTLVVSEDRNLELADMEGLLTLEHDNRGIGARLNAGFTYAAEHGYEHVCAVGNDSWLHPDRFHWLPDADSILCTRNYTAIRPDGSEQLWLRLGYDGGTGSRVIPLHWLERCDYKPLDPYQMSGCDTGTLLAIVRGLERAPNLIYTDLHPYEVMGFQSNVQVTALGDWVAYYLVERQPVFHGLDSYYPTSLVRAIRAVYEEALCST